MIKIEELLSGDFSAYPEETRKFMEKYTERLRESIEEELVEDMADRMLKDIDKSNETFMSILTDILNNGCKGFNKMSTQSLLNIYLEKKTEEDFFNLLKRLNEEV